VKHMGKYPNRRKWIAFWVSILLILSYMTGCSYPNNMPFNGDVTFHEISLVIPQNFVRDSTQSNDEVWVFEASFYQKYIILSYKETAEDPKTVADDYYAYLMEQDIFTERTTFLGMEAVRFHTELQGKDAQELMFVYQGASYAISLRGGTEDEFNAIVNTIAMLGQNN